MPTKDDVGVYQINFSVMDYNPVLGNATGSKVVNFTVLLVNEPPVFTYVCDNERKAWEDVIFSCWINATDVYELNNLTFSSNLSWFLDKKVSRCNISTGYNSSVNVNFILDDEKVGNWSINISVTDTGAPVKMNSTVINFFVQNKNDSVLLQNINNFLGYSGNDYLIQVNASDDDLLIPQSSDPLVYKENLRFFIKNELGNNINWINILPNGTFGSVKTVYLNFTSSVGLYFVNISVIDANSYSIDSQIFFINIS